MVLPNPIGKQPSPNNQPPKKSIFDKNSGLGAYRSDVKREFMKMTDKTTAWGSHIMTPQEKLLLEKELLPQQKYGSYISPKEIDDRISKLNGYMNLAKRQGDSFQASKFRDHIDFLKKLKEK